MSDLELQQLQEKIDNGVRLAQRRLIERTIKENGDLVVEHEGEIMHIKAEELEELKAEIAARKSASPADSDRVKEELGDLLFSVCNLARHLKVDSESALEGTTAKFSRRFRAVEAAAKAAGRDLKDMTLAEMDELWENAKKR